MIEVDALVKQAASRKGCHVLQYHSLWTRKRSKRGRVYYLEIATINVEISWLKVATIG